MSSLRIGDIVIVLDNNNMPSPAIVKVAAGAVVDVLFGSGSGWGDRSSLTEVADVDSLTGTTWCRREVCG